MAKIAEQTGLKAGQKNADVDLDYCECLGWCSNSPNVEVDDSRVLFEADPKTIMDRINKGEGADNTGRVINIDEIFNNDIVGDLNNE